MSCVLLPNQPARQGDHPKKPSYHPCKSRNCATNLPQSIQVGWLLHCQGGRTTPSGSYPLIIRYVFCPCLSRWRLTLPRFRCVMHFGTIAPILHLPCFMERPDVLSYLSPPLHTIDLCICTCLNEVSSGGLGMSFCVVHAGADRTHRCDHLTKCQGKGTYKQNRGQTGSKER